MKVLLQRVKSANVRIEGKTKGKIGPGILLFIGVGKESSKEQIPKIVKKISNLRIFENESGKLDKSILDISGEALIISQFTLYSNLKKGNRPDFSPSASYEQGLALYNEFITEFLKLGIKTDTGLFGANMQVELMNDGPLTIMLDSDSL